MTTQSPLFDWGLKHIKMWFEVRSKESKERSPLVQEIFCIMFLPIIQMDHWANLTGCQV